MGGGNMNKEEFFNIVKPYSMTSKERIDSLFESLECIRKNNIDGDLVECGVGQGGNILGMMEYLKFYRVNKKVWAFDTFEGMTAPEAVDVDLHGNKASNTCDTYSCRTSIERFTQIVSACGDYKEFLSVVRGDVCETLRIKENLPEKISLLRLDTDWYKSTLIELEKLYPLLSKNGFLIVDDYGHWRGSKKAVDEYFKNKIKIKKIDYTGILIIKDEK
jgi:O-methyltransferase